MVFGQCKDVSINFVNLTGLKINIPREGHRVKNPGGVEGWNNLTLGSSVVLAPGEDDDVQQNLNIKCVRDAEFEIHYSGEGDDEDFVQIFTGRNIEGKNVTLTLTNH